MASVWFLKGLVHALKGDITGGLDAADIKVALVESTYSVDQADEVIGDVSPIAATSANVTGQTVAIVDGEVQFSCDAVTWPTVAEGAACNKVVAYWDSGSAGTRYVIACNDLASAVTPDGNDINLTWGADGVAKISPPA